MKEIAALYRSLEDETRLRILGLLVGVRELCVCHLIEVLGLPQSTVSRHLATLKNAGWLRDRREGVWIHYAIAPELSAAHRAVLEGLRPLLAANETARRDQARLAAWLPDRCG